LNSTGTPWYQIVKRAFGFGWQPNSPSVIASYAETGMNFFTLDSSRYRRVFLTRSRLTP